MSRTIQPDPHPRHGVEWWGTESLVPVRGKDPPYRASPWGREVDRLLLNAGMRTIKAAKMVGSA